MCARRSGAAPDPRSAMRGGRPSASARALAWIVERASRPQSPAAAAYVDRLHRAHPDASPADIVAKLEKRYLAAVMICGLAVGSVATFPGIGTLAALVGVVGESALFLEATALFVLALAEVYGLPLDNGDRPESRRALVLTVLVGAGGKAAVAELLGPARTKGGWIADGMAVLPLPAAAQLNWRMLRYVAKRYTLRRGALLLGKLLPVGIGAVVGAVGNRIAGKKIVANARTAFGAPPLRRPVALHLLPPVHQAG